MAIRLPKPKGVTGSNQTTPANQRPLSNDMTAYIAPTTEIVPLTDYHGEYNDSKFYSWEGRIGRIQYMAYPTFFAFFAILLMMLLFLTMGGIQTFVQGGSENASAGMAIIIGGLWLVMLYIQFATTKRRLNDLNKTGWWSLILFIPILSLVLYIYLLVVKGDAGANNYGLPPKPPSKLAIFVGVVLPILSIVMIGIIAALAIPAYNNYLNRMKTAQSAEHATINQSPKPVASTTSPSTETVANESLRQETVVITADQLNQGSLANNPSAQNPTSAANSDATHSDSETAVAEKAATNNGQNDSNTNATAKPSTVQVEAAIPSESTTNKPANTNSQTNNQSNSQSNNQGTMSYEDFVKTAEKPIFTDR